MLVRSTIPCSPTEPCDGRATARSDRSPSLRWVWESTSSHSGSALPSSAITPVAVQSWPVSSSQSPPPAITSTAARNHRNVPAGNSQRHPPGERLLDLDDVEQHRTILEATSIRV